MKMSSKFVMALAGSIVSSSLPAITPETGLYWDADQSGKGFYIEVQGNTGLVIFYAGSPETAKPEYYLATGIFMANPLPIDEPSYLGIDPADGFNGQIVRLTDSVPCLTCSGIGYVPANHAEKVGDVQLNFRFLNTADMIVTWNDGQAMTYVLHREIYGLPVVSDTKDELSALDLRGEWVFTDETDPSRIPWRYQFTQVISTFDSSMGSVTAAFEYIDVARNAIFHCNVSVGCSLSQGGIVLFSARYEDIGVQTIQAFLGVLPNLAGTGIYRTSQTVIGTRIIPSHVPGH